MDKKLPTLGELLNIQANYSQRLNRRCLVYFGSTPIHYLPAGVTLGLVKYFYNDTPESPKLYLEYVTVEAAKRAHFMMGGRDVRFLNLPDQPFIDALPHISSVERRDYDFLNTLIQALREYPTNFLYYYFRSIQELDNTKSYLDGLFMSIQTGEVDKIIEHTMGEYVERSNRETLKFLYRIVIGKEPED
ncbi:MAG: hypothetical protein ACRYGG_14425 [Janthinobacterium lividum]